VPYVVRAGATGIGVPAVSNGAADEERSIRPEGLDHKVDAVKFLGSLNWDVAANAFIVGVPASLVHEVLRKPSNSLIKVCVVN
jgi:hypothetical protein